MSDTMVSDPVAPYRAKDVIFTPSNLISIMRAMFVLPAIFCIVASQQDTRLYFLVAAIFVAAALTDVLDGIIARKTNTVSELGKIVDPLADKIFIGFVVIAMAVYGLIPLWFIGIILGRDLIILAGGWWAKKKLGVVLPSNYPGKIAVITVALTLLFMVIRAGISGNPRTLISLIVFLEWTSVVLMAASLVVYGARLKRLLSTAHSTA
ncbi:MAG TPA: CDP-alcohol phosphatidyltransferase family protein [Candidatus Kapabacteria bacterium]|nr:CDP-alcohol phosphatidyltransferase family protein [Candidatus Kapabacteria bacterium]